MILTNAVFDQQSVYNLKFWISGGSNIRIFCVFFLFFAARARARCVVHDHYGYPSKLRHQVSAGPSTERFAMLDRNGLHNLNSVLG